MTEESRHSFKDLLFSDVACPLALSLTRATSVDVSLWSSSAPSNVGQKALVPKISVHTYPSASLPAKLQCSNTQAEANVMQLCGALLVVLVGNTRA